MQTVKFLFGTGELIKQFRHGRLMIMFVFLFFGIHMKNHVFFLPVGMAQLKCGFNLKNHKLVKIHFENIYI